MTKKHHARKGHYFTEKSTEELQEACELLDGATESYALRRLISLGLKALREESQAN